MKTVQMTRDSNYPEPHTADVAESEVVQWQAAGWVVVEKPESEEGGEPKGEEGDEPKDEESNETEGEGKKSTTKVKKQKSEPSDESEHQQEAS